MRKKDQAVIYILYFLVNMIYGALKRSFGVVIPSLSRALGVSPAVTGSLYSIVLWSRIPSVFICSIFSDKNPRMVMFIGSLLFFLGGAGMIFPDSLTYWWVASMMILMGVGLFMAGYSSKVVIVKANQMGRTIDMIPGAMAKNFAVLYMGTIALIVLKKFGVGQVFFLLGLSGIITVIIYIWYSLKLNLDLKSSWKPSFNEIVRYKGIWKIIQFMIIFEGVLVGIFSIYMYQLRNFLVGYNRPQMITIFIITVALPALISRPVWGIFTKIYGARWGLISGMLINFLGLLIFVIHPIIGIIILSVGSGAGTVSFMPYLADRWGRKKTAEVFGVICIPYMMVASVFPWLVAWMYQNWGCLKLCLILTLLCILSIGLMAEKNIKYIDRRSGKREI